MGYPSINMYSYLWFSKSQLKTRNNSAYFVRIRPTESNQNISSSCDDWWQHREYTSNKFKLNLHLAQLLERYIIKIRELTFALLILQSILLIAWTVFISLWFRYFWAKYQKIIKQHKTVRKQMEISCCSWDIRVWVFLQNIIHKRRFSGTFKLKFSY